jgi:chemotaxis protein methyltransferase CheR
VRRAEPSLTVPYGLRPLTDAEFGAFQKLVAEEAGIQLTAAKKALLVGRLAKRLRALGLDSFGQYHERVQHDQEERVHMLDAICTNETQFFREPRQFEFLATRVYPAWRAAAEAGTRSRTIRAWSAACSSGEEPYSLAMSLLTHFPATAGWSIEILATDLSTSVLARAEAGVWPMEKADSVPEAFRRRFLLRGVGPQEGRVKMGPELRSVVRFARMNLNDSAYPIVGTFDLVFCRNVLIYFGAAARERVIARLLGRLAPGGLLLLGHAETLSGTEQVRSVGPTVYARRADVG